MLIGVPKGWDVPEREVTRIGVAPSTSHQTQPRASSSRSDGAVQVHLALAEEDAEDAVATKSLTSRTTMDVVHRGLSIMKRPIAPPLALSVCSLVILIFGFPFLLSTQEATSLREEVRRQGFARRVVISDSFLLNSPEALVRESDLVIQGRVVSEKTRLSKDERDVWTDYTVEVLGVLKDDSKLVKTGDRLAVTKKGGNFSLDGKPIRVDTPDFPPIPWITPHVFFVARWDDPGGDGNYHFLGAGLGVVPIRHGKADCGTASKSNHPAVKPFCGKPEAELIDFLKKEIRTLSKP